MLVKPQINGTDDFETPIIRGVPNDADAYQTRMGAIRFQSGDTGKYNLIHAIGFGSIYNLKTGKSAQPLNKFLQGKTWSLWSNHGTTKCYWTRKQVRIPPSTLLQYLPWGKFPRTDLYYESVSRTESLFIKEAD